MALLQLSRSGFRNHVTVLYADGTHYTIRNAHEIVVDRDINRLFISTKSSKQCNIADGVISVKNNSEMVYIDIGILAGVEVTHAVDDFANKMELKTSFSFMNRGEICGGVLVKNPVSLVLQNDSGTIKNLKDFSDFACFVLNRCEKSL
ncbi:hypothetical protein [Alishewanella phage vB_AspM_Slickus01]|nr:hypothetical protein [Alishewanella phage vB_AspM_Slickus01]